MWGEVLNENVLFKAATAAPQMPPGVIGRFGRGVLAMYIQGAAALDNDTLAAGEPSFLMAPLSAWDSDAYTDPNTAANAVGRPMYVATNNYGVSGAIDGLVVGHGLMGGLALVAIPESYWGWSLIKGYCSFARCYDNDLAANEYLQIDQAITTSLGLGVEKCSVDGAVCVGYTFAADDGTAHTVEGYFDFIGGLGTQFDIE